MSSADEKPSSNGDKGGESDKSVDNAIAKAAGAVIATGIAWSVFKAFWPTKAVQEELEAASEEVSTLEGEAKEKLEGFAEKASSTGSSIARRFPKFRKSSKGQAYEVCYGDTLYGISRKYNVTVDAIKEANCLSTDFIVEGDKLKIPS